MSIEPPADVPSPPPVISVAEATGPPTSQSSWGMLLLCAVAIVGQLTGLRSLIQYGAEREGWSAQKQHFASVQTEWDQLSKEANLNLVDLKKQRDALTAEIAKLEDDRKRLSEDFATVKGQYASLSQSRDDAISVQLRAQQQEQAALDAAQAAKTRVADLKKQKDILEEDVSQLTEQRSALQVGVEAYQATLESQKEQIAKQTQDLNALDARLSASRDELRKHNEALVTASDELAKVLNNKQAAVAATANSVDEKDRIDRVRLEFSKLSGQVAALKTEKESLDTELSREETRLQNAKVKLADYLEQWKTRETITKELATLHADTAKVAAEKKVLEGTLGDLKSQQGQLEFTVSSKQKELSDLQSRIDTLRTEDGRLTAAVLDKAKVLLDERRPEGKPGSPPETTAKPE